MRNEWKATLSVLGVILLLGLVIVSVSANATTTTATRIIVTPSLKAGESTQITVSISTTECCAVLKEVVPTGWAISEATATGGEEHRYRASTNEFFGLNTEKSALGEVTATYTLTVPEGTVAKDYDISGTVFRAGGADDYDPDYDLTLCNVTGDTKITVTEGVMKGDFDGDGDIDLTDFVTFVGAYGSSEGDVNYNSAGDFDDDGDIDLTDFVAFVAVYGT